MKHKLTLLAVLLVALTMPAVAQDKPKANPDEALYSIKGKINYRNGQRWLDNPVGKRITFEYDSTSPALPTEKADLMVRFDFFKTDHVIEDLDFWRYDDEMEEWIYDREVRQGEMEQVTRMTTNVMLVIDNSASLGKDFPLVQESAVKFVNHLYTASQEKGVTFRVGIIGFSTIKFTKIREITVLDEKNYKDIVQFILNLSKENGTALYYSLDKALSMLEKDTKDNISLEEYRESRIYAFTDGLDQASIDDKRGLITPTKYYEYLATRMKGPNRKKIMGLKGEKDIRSTIVTVQGDDMTEKQVALFDQRAQGICDSVRKLDDMKKLESEFKKLAEELVNSNFIIKCYIPEGVSGMVGWTFAEKRKPKKNVKLWLGLGLDGGLALQPYEKYKYNFTTGQYYLSESGSETAPFGGARIDLAVPFSSSFAMGITASALFGGEGFGYGVGALAIYTLKNNSAIMASGGIKNVVGIVHPYVSLGWKFRSPWYVNAFAAFGGGIREIGVGVGYTILDGKDKNNANKSK